MPNTTPRPDHPVSYIGYYCGTFKTEPISRRQTPNHVPTTGFRTIAIIIQGSVPYESLDDKQQTTTQPPGWMQWPLLYKVQFSTFLRTTNSKPRPDYSVTYNGQKRTTISTVPIARRSTRNHVPITLLQTTGSTVQRSVPYLSPNAQQRRSS